MRKFLAIAAATAICAFASQASAQTFKLKFEGADAQSLVVTFNSTAMTFTNDKGASGTYTWDEANKKVCTLAAGTTTCGTLAAILKNAGETTTSVDDKGNNYKVTFVSVE